MAMKSFKRIAALSDQQRSILHTMFYEKRGVPAIIKAFRETFGLWTDVEVTSLEKFLYRYKKEVIEKNLVKLTPPTPSTKVALLNCKEGIDVLEEMAQLVMVQKGRVQKLQLMENDIPVLLGSLGGEMKLLAGFVKEFAELGFDFGFIKRVPKQTKITQEGGSTLVESDGKTGVMVSLQNSDKLEDAANKFFEILEMGAA